MQMKDDIKKNIVRNGNKSFIYFYSRTCIQVLGRRWLCEQKLKDVASGTTLARFRR